MTRLWVVWALGLIGVAANADASSIKARTQSVRLLREILPCAATLAVNANEPASSLGAYNLMHQQRLLLARNVQPTAERAVELVMGEIATEVKIAGNVDAWDPNGEFEKLFKEAEALQQKDGKSPAGAARVEHCVAMTKRLAPSFEISDAAAIRFGLYAQNTPQGAELIDTSESDSHWASRAAKSDAKRNVEEFTAGKGYLTRCNFAEDDDLYSFRPVLASTETTSQVATRAQMQTLAAEGRSVFVPCTYAGIERTRYQGALGHGGAAFLPLLPVAGLRFNVPGLANAAVQHCGTSVNHQRREELTRTVDTYEYNTTCGAKMLEDINASTDLKGVGEVVLLAQQDTPPLRRAQHQRMHCALYVRDLDYVVRQLPAFLAAVGGWSSLQDYQAQQSLWKAQNYARTSGNYSALQLRENANEMIARGRATKSWARKISDEVYFPASHLNLTRSQPGAVIPDGLDAVLTQVLGTGPSILWNIEDPRVQSPACKPRKRSLSERYVRLLQTKKEEKEISDKIWGSNERAGDYGIEGSDDGHSLHCYRFDDAVDPLVCAPYYPQLWAMAERLPPVKEIAVTGEDIY